MNSDVLNFWNELQRTAKFYAEESNKRKLNNFEFTMYSQICQTLETYLKITENQIRPEEHDEPDGDPGELSSETP
jgi:hypothetical protein